VVGLRGWASGPFPVPLDPFIFSYLVPLLQTPVTYTWSSLRADSSPDFSSFHVLFTSQFSPLLDSQSQDPIVPQIVIVRANGRALLSEPFSLTWFFPPQTWFFYGSLYCLAPDFRATLGVARPSPGFPLFLRSSFLLMSFPSWLVVVFTRGRGRRSVPSPSLFGDFSPPRIDFD